MATWTPARYYESGGVNLKRKMLLVVLAVVILACQGCEVSEETRARWAKESCMKYCLGVEAEFDYYVHDSVDPDCWCKMPNGTKTQLW